MKTVKKVMLGISCGARNAARAVASIALFGSAVAREKEHDFEIRLGLELAGDRREAAFARILAMAQDAWPKYCEFYFWDTLCDDIVLSRLEPNFPKPFSPSFSYGGASNKRLLLAARAKCDFLFRIDPGLMVSPSYGINWVLERPLRAFASNDNLRFMSGNYEGRLAVRTDNIYTHKTERCLEMVKEYTKIDPKKQLTGGISVMKVADTGGIPFIPFDPFKDSTPTLVWASDDGIMESLCKKEGEDTCVLDDWTLPRFDPVGYPKSPGEYFLGIAGMVALHELINEHGLARAKARVAEFISEVNRCELLDPEKKVNQKRGKLENTLVPEKFLEKVAEGVGRYGRLRTCWLELVATALECFSDDRNALQFLKA